MICYRCDKIKECTAFRTLYSMSKDFCVNDCDEYYEVSKYKYKKIAEHDDLMCLIYDYFTGQVQGGYTNEEVVKVITNAISNL